MSRLELLIVLTLGWHVALVHPSPELRRTSQLPELSNLQVYNNTLYVGGLGRIYSFDEELNVLQSVDTCIRPCKSNFNKILLLNETSQELMTCGTGNGGICEKRLLTNLSSVVHSSSSGDNKDINTLVVSTDRNRPAVALMWDKQLFLMAVTYGETIPIDEVNSYANAYHVLTLRTTLFNINEYMNPFGYSELQLIIYKNVSSLNDDAVYYREAIQYQDYTYLLTNQRAYVGNDTFVTKIVRLCNFDPSLRSYVDMELACQVDKVKYNLVQGATVAKLNGNDYLIASFAKGSNPEDVFGEGIICRMSLVDLNSDLSQAQLQYINEYPYYASQRYFKTYPNINFVSKHVCAQLTFVL